VLTSLSLPFLSLFFLSPLLPEIQLEVLVILVVKNLLWISRPALGMDGRNRGHTDGKEGKRAAIGTEEAKGDE